MRPPNSHWIPAFSIFALLLTGCANTPYLYDYTALENTRPRSILVIPPANNSIEVNGSYIFLATISRPLAEKGYYVFPVAVIDHFLKENGLPTPAEMNGIPLDKIAQHIGADAVLYVSIEDWGQKYKILTSMTVVHSTLRLVDVKTGDLLWATTVKATQASDDGDLGLFGAIAMALATQIAGSVSDNTPQLSSHANYLAVHDKSNGLLHGPYFNPDGAPDPISVKVRNAPADAAILLFMGKAAGEIADKSYHEKLWSTALVLAEGNEQKRKGIYIKLRSEQLASEQAMVKEAGEIVKLNGEAAGKQINLVDVSGTYVSEITTNTNWVFQRKKHRNLQIILKQRGNTIEGVSSLANLKVIGTLEDDNISFFAMPSDITDSEIKGKWQINADGTRLTGKWTHPHGDGKWNLTKIK